MLYRFSFIAISFIAFLPTSVWSQQQLRGRACEPIARVLGTGDPMHPPSSLLCTGDQLKVVGNNTIKVLCYLNSQVLQLQGSISDSPDKCVSLPHKKKCSVDNSNQCIHFKSPLSNQNGDQPTLVYPYNPYLLSTPTKLEWLSVARASQYTVSIKGNGVDWSRQVNATSIPYPPEQPKLEPGSAYTITIVADKGDTPLSYSSTVLIVSSPTEIQQIKSVEQQILTLKLRHDDQAIDLHHVYMSQNLLTEAINVLQTRIHRGTHSPRIYRLLGDRFLDAGLPELAKQQYSKAADLAQRINNYSELSKARNGIKQSELVSQKL